MQKKCSTKRSSQKNAKYICSSTYFKILYYYNKEKIDSVSKLVDYVKPIAERMKYYRLYFNAQKLLIYTYIYSEKYEYAINEALEMLKIAEELDNVDGCIAHIHVWQVPIMKPIARKKKEKRYARPINMLPSKRQAVRKSMFWAN